VQGHYIYYKKRFSNKARLMLIFLFVRFFSTALAANAAFFTSNRTKQILNNFNEHALGSTFYFVIADPLSLLCLVASQNFNPGLTYWH
jgi:hypothetical protein